MTKRERILVWGMGGAVVWVVVSLGLDSVRDVAGTAQARRQQDEIRAFVEGQRVKILPLKLKAKETFALDQAAGPWSETPFIDRAADPQSRDGRGWQFLYTGFIQVGAQRFAIVNGREYQENDPVGSGEFRVESIQPEQVTLISKTGGRRMTLALHAPKARKEPK